MMFPSSVWVAFLKTELDKQKLVPVVARESKEDFIMYCWNADPDVYSINDILETHEFHEYVLKESSAS